MLWVLRRKPDLLIPRQGLFRPLPRHRVVAERPQPGWRLLLLPLDVVADRPRNRSRHSPLEFHFSTQVAERLLLRLIDRR